MRNIFLFFLILLSVTVSAQFDSSLFITSKYNWPEKTKLTDSIKKKILSSIVLPTDTSLRMAIGCLSWLEKDTTFKDNDNKLADLISILDLNGDGDDDIVFNSYNDACGVYYSYLFYKSGDKYVTIKIPHGYISYVKWNGKHISKLYTTMPPCCMFQFNTVKYYKVKRNGQLNLKSTILYFAYSPLADTLKKCNLFHRTKISKKNNQIFFCAEPKNEVYNDSTGEFRFETYSVEMKSRRLYVFAKNGDFKLVAIRAKLPHPGPNYLSKQTYYIGWTKE